MANTLGIDIGGATVKAVVVGGARASDVRWTRAVARNGTPESVDDALGRIKREAAPPSDTVVSALSGETVPLVFVDLPFTTRKLIDRTIAFEVEEHLPGIPDDHTMVFQTLALAGDSSRVVSALAPREAIEGRLEVLREADLDPRVLDLDVLALYTCALALPCESEVRAVVDIGATKTLVVVLHGERLTVARVIGIGAAEATRRIAARLGLPEAEAEQAKRAYAADAELSAEPPVDADDARQALHQEILGAYGEILDDVAVTLQATERAAGREIGEVLLVGGGARPRGLDELAHAQLGCPVAVASAPPGASIGDDLWPDAAVAYGLALRGARANQGSHINFRTGDFAYGREVKELARRVVPLALPVAIILGSILVSVGVRMFDKSRELARLEAGIAATFQAQFPNEPLLDPQAQVARHRGEIERKIRMLTGPSSAIEVLSDLSVAVPGSLQIIVDEFLLEGNRLTLRGRTDSYDALNSMRQALTDHEGFRDVRIEEQDRSGSQTRYRIVARVGGE